MFLYDNSVVLFQDVFREYDILVYTLCIYANIANYLFPRTVQQALFKSLQFKNAFKDTVM